MHSITNRSPDHLIEEIILIDDKSDMDHLKEPLDQYMKSFPKVKILRHKDRQGLIRCRMFGATRAKAKVLTFLDSHIEAEDGWLEPLLHRVKDQPKVKIKLVISSN